MPISILMLKIFLTKYLPPVKPKLVPKLKIAQKVLKFDTSDISGMPISILMSKIIIIKYLPPVRHKLVPKL